MATGDEMRSMFSRLALTVCLGVLFLEAFMPLCFRLLAASSLLSSGGQSGSHMAQSLLLSGVVSVVLRLLTVLGMWLWCRRGRPESATCNQNSPPIRYWAVSVVCGVVLAAIATAVPAFRGTGLLLWLVATPFSSDVPTFVHILLLAVSALVLPLLAESFFRDFLFRDLTDAGSTASAVLTSSLLFAYFWPLSGFWLGLLLGLVLALLYNRARTLWVPIIAHVTFLLSSLVFTVGAHFR